MPTFSVYPSQEGRYAETVSLQHSGQKITLNIACKPEPTLPKVFKSMSACELTLI
jgi:hypothetical protein